MQEQNVPTVVEDREPEISQSGTSLESAAAAGPVPSRRAWLPLSYVLWNRRRLMERFIAGGLILATVLAFVLPKRYESTARLMPPDSRSTSGMAMLATMASSNPALSGLASNLLGIKTSGAVFVGILTSRTVADRLVDRFDLRKVYYVRRWESARKILAKRSDISENPKNGIITITVSDRDPSRAAAMSSAYVQELDRLVVDLNTSTAHRERVFLEERLKSVKVDLDAAAKSLSEFSSRNTTLDVKEQGRAMVEAGAKLQGELIAAESELRGLQQIYTNDNVRVRSVSARVAELRRQLEKLGGTAQESNPQARDAEALYPSLRQLPLLGFTYTDLYRRMMIQETLYETLTKQYELAKVEEAKETPSVRVLDQPIVAEKKSFPPRLLIIFGGTFLGFVFGVVWVITEARWQETEEDNPTKQFLNELRNSVKYELQHLAKSFWRRHAERPARRK